MGQWNTLEAWERNHWNEETGDGLPCGTPQDAPTNYPFLMYYETAGAKYVDDRWVGGWINIDSTSPDYAALVFADPCWAAWDTSLSNLENWTIRADHALIPVRTGPIVFEMKVKFKEDSLLGPNSSTGPGVGLYSPIGGVNGYYGHGLTLDMDHVTENGTLDDVNRFYLTINTWPGMPSTPFNPYWNGAPYNWTFDRTTAQLLDDQWHVIQIRWQNATVTKASNGDPMHLEDGWIELWWDGERLHRGENIPCTVSTWWWSTGRDHWEITYNFIYNVFGGFHGMTCDYEYFRLGQITDPTSLVQPNNMAHPGY